MKNMIKNIQITFFLYEAFHQLSPYPQVHNTNDENAVIFIIVGFEFLNFLQKHKRWYKYKQLHSF